MIPAHDIPRHFPPSSHCLFPWHTNLCETAQPNLSQWILFTACMWDGRNAFQLSICFVKSQNETRVILYPKMKRWKKGQKHSIVINKTKSACTCTGYNTINNAGKNLAWRYVPGSSFVSSSCTRHNSESNLHYSALDLKHLAHPSMVQTPAAFECNLKLMNICCLGL